MKEMSELDESSSHYPELLCHLGHLHLLLEDYNKGGCGLIRCWVEVVGVDKLAYSGVLR